MIIICTHVHTQVQSGRVYIYLDSHTVVMCTHVYTHKFHMTQIPLLQPPTAWDAKFYVKMDGIAAKAGIPEHNKPELTSVPIVQV